MKFQTISGGLLIAAASLALPAQANSSDNTSDKNGLFSDIIVVTAHREQADNLAILAEESIPARPDTAALVARLPGAALVGNGSLSGQIQFRGAYGFRVGTRVNDQAFRSGGPNLMDPPMHYAPPTLVDTIEVTRGVAPLSFGPSLSAGVAANLKQVPFSTTSSLQSSFDVTLIGRTADDSHAAGLVGGVASDTFRAFGYYSDERGSDLDYPDGRLDNTFHDREVYGAGLGFRHGDSTWTFELRRQESGPTGNPPFAMDIDYVDTDFARLGFTTLLGETSVKLRLGFSDVAHGMNNFDHRPPPAAMRHRLNETKASTVTAGIDLQTPLGSGELTYGADLEQGDHEARISNPNNAAFFVDQVPDIEQDRIGVYLSWQSELGAGGYEAGVRVDRYDDSAANAVTGPALPMGPMMLAGAFNASDRDWEETTVDLMFRYWRETDAGTWRFSLARKHRAPTYLERYAWLPTAASAGLADGNNYIGNLGLDPETAWIAEIGIDLGGRQWWLRPTVFFHQVDDYIQGIAVDATPGVVDSPVEMVSMMNGDPSPLRFSNVDARMFGLDADYGWQLSGNWRLEGVLSLVRGERRDISDDLYRISPDRFTLGLVYERADWSVRLEAEGVRRQDRVSATNSEQSTAGYGLLNLSANWRVSDGVTLSGGIDNLADREYAEHLAGYNRVMGSDVAVGERMPGTGRNLFLRFALHY